MISPSLQTLLTMIETVEKCYPHDDWKTTAIRLRKTHYNSTLWSLFLAESIAIEPASTQQGVPSDIIKKFQSGDVTFEDPDGHPVDMGHIWALINGLSQPKMDHLIKELSGLDAPDALSWVGDIGSVVTAYVLKQDGPDQSMAHYFKNLAGDADIYGDVDGYGVYCQQVDSALPLSKRIAAYYESNYQHRLSYFASEAGLKITQNDGRNVIDQHAIDQVIFPQVKEFTFFWTLHVSKMSKVECAIEELSNKLYSDDDINQAIALYVDWIAQA